MNFKHILMFASAAVFASACTEEIAPVQEPDVTPVVLAENEMAARLPKMLDLGWSKGDKLTVISASASQEFTILDDYSVSLAKFKGEALSGDSFTILKSDATSLQAAEAKSCAAQVQTADGNIDHLNIDLALVGVSTYKDVTFTQEWAAENGGALKMNGVLKINAQFPGQVHVLDGLGFKADKALFFGTNGSDSATDSLYLDTKSVDVSVKGYKYTGYMLTSWQTATITEADQITAWAHYDGKAYFAVLPSQNLVIEGGKIAEISIESTAWELYDMNPGSKHNPYKISTKADLLAMPSQLEAGYTRYFELMADIDLDGEAWVPVNTDAAAFKEMIFEGNNHKISNLTLNSDSEYPSFAGVFMGSMKNVTFENPSVTANVAKANAAGIVAAMAAYPSGDANVVLENVNVTGAALNVTGSYAIATGILAGSVKNAEIKNCHTTGTVTHAGANAECNIGGFIGKVDGGQIRECTHKGDVTINTIGRVFGGFIGSIRATASVENCHYEGILTATGTTTYSGLFIGYVAANSSVLKDCTAKGTFNGVDDNCGGFAGNVPKNLTNVLFDNCDTDMTLNFGAGGSNVGGLIGSVQSGIVVRGCDVTGTINVTKSIDYVGGVVGYGAATSNNLLIEKCSFDGYIGKKDHNRSVHAGIISYIGASGTVVKNCWSAGEIDGANHSVGGICGTTLPTTEITCCYSTMKITGGHAVGGILGRAENHKDMTQSTTDLYNNTVSKCIAWNPTIISRRKPLNPAKNHSCAAVVGKTVKFNTMEDCYRRADIVLDVYDNVELDTPFDQENSNSTTELLWNYEAQYYCPYHGKAAAADATVSSVAKTLGWDETVWDLSGDLPKLK